MEGMPLNYVLLAITGIWTIMNIYSFKRGTGDVKIFRSVLTAILFVLVLIATIMGIDYITFKSMIEGA